MLLLPLFFLGLLLFPCSLPASFIPRLVFHSACLCFRCKNWMTCGELWIKVNVNHLLFLKSSLLQAILPGGFWSLWGFTIFPPPFSLLFSLSNFAHTRHMLIAFLGYPWHTHTVSISDPLISLSPHRMSCSTPPWSQNSFAFPFYFLTLLVCLWPLSLLAITPTTVLHPRPMQTREWKSPTRVMKLNRSVAAAEATNLVMGKELWAKLGRMRKRGKLKKRTFFICFYPEKRTTEMADYINCPLSGCRFH